MKRFQHEDMEVYRLAIEFFAIAVTLAERIPRSRWFLAHQLLEAAASIAFKLAEGASEFSPTEKARFYRMSRRSGGECAAAMDVLVRIGTLTEPEAEAHKVLLRKIAGMLTRMVQAVEARPSASRPAPRAAVARPKTTGRARAKKPRARPKKTPRARAKPPRARARPRARANTNSRGHRGA